MDIFIFTYVLINSESLLPPTTTIGMQNYVNSYYNTMAIAIVVFGRRQFLLIAKKQ